MNFNNPTTKNDSLEGDKIFDLNVVLERIHASCLQKIDSNKLEFSFESEEVIGNLVRGDVKYLERTLMALISQVCDSTDEGSVSIKMNLMIRSEQYFIVRFKMLVKQSHPGISDTETDEQESNTSFQEVRKEIDSLGGSLEYSETSKGDKVYTLVLPFEDSGEKKPLMANVDSVQSELLRTMNVLLVIKDEEDEQLFQSLFEEWKCNYSIKRNLIEIAKEVKGNKPDIILLNVNNNEGEFADLNLQNFEKNNANITTIAFSEISTLSTIKQRLGDYCDKLIIKPFDSTRLKELIIKLVESNIQKPDPRNQCFNRN